MKIAYVSAIAAAVFALAQPAQAVVFTVNGYTSNSVTFSVSGQMPTTNPGTLLDGPMEIDIQYSGNLYLGDGACQANSLTADPVAGAGGLNMGNTGGFGTPTDYSWLYFNNDLTGLFGTGSSVTLTWGGRTYLTLLARAPSTSSGVIFQTDPAPPDKEIFY